MFDGYLLNWHSVAEAECDRDGHIYLMKHDSLDAYIIVNSTGSNTILEDVDDGFCDYMRKYPHFALHEIVYDIMLNTIRPLYLHITFKCEREAKEYCKKHNFEFGSHQLIINKRYSDTTLFQDFMECPMKETDVRWMIVDKYGYDLCDDYRIWQNDVLDNRIVISRSLCPLDDKSSDIYGYLVIVD